jgi:cell division protein ZapA
MAQVDIMVNERIYKVTCDDGQESRLHQLAAHIDDQVRSLVRELGQIGDARLILLAALTVCDELFEARAALSEASDSDAPLDAETIGGASRILDAAAKRVEQMAERLSAA